MAYSYRAYLSLGFGLVLLITIVVTVTLTHSTASVRGDRSALLSSSLSSSPSVSPIKTNNRSTVDGESLSYPRITLCYKAQSGDVGKTIMGLMGVSMLAEKLSAPLEIDFSEVYVGAEFLQVAPKYQVTYQNRQNTVFWSIPDDLSHSACWIEKPWLDIVRQQFPNTEQQQQLYIIITTNAPLFVYEACNEHYDAEFFGNVPALEYQTSLRLQHTLNELLVIPSTTWSFADRINNRCDTIVHFTSAMHYCSARDIQRCFSDIHEQVQYWTRKGVYLAASNHKYEPTTSSDFWYGRHELFPDVSDTELNNLIEFLATTRCTNVVMCQWSYQGKAACFSPVNKRMFALDRNLNFSPINRLSLTINNSDTPEAQEILWQSVHKDCNLWK